jgi:hypothetical protein
MGQINLNGRMSVAIAKNRLVSCMGLKGPPKKALVAFHPFVLCNGATWQMGGRIEFFVTLHAKGKRYSDLARDIRDLTHV